MIFVLAKIGYSGSLVYYDSMLSDVTTPERMDDLSSRGYAWGYIGSASPLWSAWRWYWAQGPLV